MKLLEITLLEHYVNLLTREDKEKYVDQVWDMLQRAYEPIGGFKSAVDKDDLIDDSSLWKMVRKGGKIVAVSIYKDQHGRKSIAMATDRTPEGKTELMKLKSEDTKLQRSWCEASGKAETLLLKVGAKPLSNKLAGKLTKKEILGYDVDGVHYTRLIHGVPHVKAIYGFPKLTDELKAELEQNDLELNTPVNEGIYDAGANGISLARLYALDAAKVKDEWRKMALLFDKTNDPNVFRFKSAQHYQKALDVVEKYSKKS